MSGRIRVLLSSPSGLSILEPGSYFVGRSTDCDIVLASGRASRRHAKIVVTEVGATIEDLASANGVFVNGERLGNAPKKLANDDFIVIGDLALEVSFETAPTAQGPFSSEPIKKAAPRPPSMPPGMAATGRANALELLVAVAERALAQGQPDRAERAVDEWLLTTLQAARSGQRAPDQTNQLAMDIALRLATALSAPRWVDYVFHLLTALGEPIGEQRAHALAHAIAVAGVQPGCLDTYAAKLRQLPQIPAVAHSVEFVQYFRAQPRR